MIGLVISGLIDSRARLKVEEKKIQGELLVEAIRAGTREDAAKNLLFLLDVGLISDNNGTISLLREEPSRAPLLLYDGSKPIFDWGHDPRLTADMEEYKRSWKEWFAVNPDTTITGMPHKPIMVDLDADTTSIAVGR